MHLAIGLALCVLLMIVVVDDLKYFTIRNATVLALVGLFAVKSVAARRNELLPGHLAFGGAVFCLLLLAYAANLAGGGDIKLLSAAFLWFGLPCSAAFSVALVVTTLAYSLIARMGSRADAQKPTGRCHSVRPGHCGGLGPDGILPLLAIARPCR